MMELLPSDSMKLARTPLLLALLEQQPVPVDWPKRVGYPPPGIIRKTAYPAGNKVSHQLLKKRRKHEEKSGPGYIPYDDEYPCTPEGKKLAKAHAWELPSKRIKVCGKIHKT